jgi:HPt (histidine-containing phosphotransfer) domain-containing protein
MDDSSPSLPESTPASPVPDSVSETDDPDADAPNADASAAGVAEALDVPDGLPDEHREVVRRLSQQVAAAVETIEELRAENERLRRRVEELEAGPEIPDDETLLTLDDDPDAVREQITEFIDTIDSFLATASDADEPARS